MPHLTLPHTHSEAILYEYFYGPKIPMPAEPEPEFDYDEDED